MSREALGMLRPVAFQSLYDPAALRHADEEKRPLSELVTWRVLIMKERTP
jgi:hypothetical protein